MIKNIKLVLKNVIKVAKGLLNYIFEDSFNKILSQQLTHDRSYISDTNTLRSLRVCFDFFFFFFFFCNIFFSSLHIKNELDTVLKSLEFLIRYIFKNQHTRTILYLHKLYGKYVFKFCLLKKVF